jgi:hypothetical protein
VSNQANNRRKHTQRIKLGIIVVCTPWLLLGLIGLVSAGVTAARPARLPIDELRPVAIATISVCGLVSVVGVALTILGIAGLLLMPKPKGDQP